MLRLKECITTKHIDLNPSFYGAYFSRDLQRQTMPNASFFEKDR